VLITNLSTAISYESLCSEMRDICKFDTEQPFTVKWVDEEGLFCPVFLTVLNEYIASVDIVC